MLTIELGATARDKITGFRGVITGLVTYISGCNQALIVPPAKPDGDLPAGQWIDMQRIEMLDIAIVRLDNTVTPGADIAPGRRF